MNQKAKQTNSRREQVKKAGSTVFIAVAIAAVIVMFSFMSIKFLWERKTYNDRVITAKTKARDDIRNNLTNLDKLAEQFPSLDASASTNSKVILHALPPVYDYAALASSIDSLAVISGVSSDTSVGEDLSASSLSTASTSSPVEIPISLEVKGNYASVRKYIENLERSIRPINVTNVAYTGTNASLTLTLQAVTYYQPSRSLDVLRSPIQ